MAKRENHYEAAFEAYLRGRLIPYVAVDESRRALAQDGSLKSLDFLVSPAGGPSWLIDVKGRRFPGGEAGRHYWKNWTQAEDLVSLARWEELFGAGFGGLLVFAYLLVGDRAPLPRDELFTFRGRSYGFVGIHLADYARHARPISESWETVAMPTRRFRQLARPLTEFWNGPGSNGRRPSHVLEFSGAS